MKKIKPDFVVILGDTLHSHEKVDSRCLNLAIKLIDTIRKIKPVFVLIGNHDYIHNKVFLTDQHPFNALKEWNHVYIIDRPKSFNLDNKRFVFCPYVEDGRLQEALATLETSIDVVKPKAIFCHATFKGAILDNGMASEVGENVDQHFYISGHIHKSGWIGDHVFYPGTPYQTSFGEDEKKGLYSVIFDDAVKPKIKRIDLLLPKKIVIKADVKELATLQLPNTSHIEIKLVVTGDLSEIKEKKREIEEKYKDFPIQLKPSTKMAQGKYRGKHFKDVLLDLIQDHHLALNIYNECYS